MPFTVTWKNIKIVILSEVGQTEKDKKLCNITYMGNLKKKKTKRIYKTKVELQV